MAETVAVNRKARHNYEITDTFEAYGYRRMGAALRHRGLVVNAKKVRRLMRENGYPNVQVHTPAGFARPLLVGYTQPEAAVRHRAAARL